MPTPRTKKAPAERIVLDIQRGLIDSAEDTNAVFRALLGRMAKNVVEVAWVAGETVPESLADVWSGQVRETEVTVRESARIEELAAIVDADGSRVRRPFAMVDPVTMSHHRGAILQALLESRFGLSEADAESRAWGLSSVQSMAMFTREVVDSPFGGPESTPSS